MEQLLEWQKFENTGKVEDYLNYVFSKDEDKIYDTDKYYDDEAK